MAYTSLSGMIKNTNDFYNLTYNYNATYSHTGDLDITVHATNLTQETVLTNGFLSVRKKWIYKNIMKKVTPNNLAYFSLGAYGSKSEGSGTFLQSVGPYAKIG